MENKKKQPIIIDGVDVSECENYGHNCSCEHNPYCLYKEHQRKIAECEELKERLKCNCFDPNNSNNRCVSYNRIAEDYERDSKILNRYEQALNEIENLSNERKYTLQYAGFCNTILNIISKAKGINNEL